MNVTFVLFTERVTTLRRLKVLIGVVVVKKGGGVAMITKQLVHYVFVNIIISMNKSGDIRRSSALPR